MGPRDRLLASFSPRRWRGGCCTRIDFVAVPGLDMLLAIPVGSLLFTMFAVGGVAHAVNIIDGYNGLAGMVVLMVTAAIAYVAFQVADYQIFAVACAVRRDAGFLVEFSARHDFCGDGGAYLWGFVLGVLSVLLIEAQYGGVAVVPAGVGCCIRCGNAVFDLSQNLFAANRPAHPMACIFT